MNDLAEKKANAQVRKRKMQHRMEVRYLGVDSLISDASFEPL